MSSNFNSSLSIPHHVDDDDDDFQIPVSQTPRPLTLTSTNTSRKKPKRSSKPGKENIPPIPKTRSDIDDFKLDENCSLDLIESSIDCSFKVSKREESVDDKNKSNKKEGLAVKGGYLCNSIEARLLRTNSRVDCGQGGLNEDDRFGDSEESSELDVLIKLCTEDEDKVNGHDDGGGCCLVQCPLCGTDISDLSDESRLLHTNDCLDKAENQAQDVSFIS